MFTRRTVGLGLLSWMVATTLFAYPDDYQLQELVGGLVLAGCKQPCDDTKTLTRQECLDPCNFFHPIDPKTGKRTPCTAAERSKISGICNKNYCTVNTYQLFKCDPGAPGSGEKKCEYHWAKAGDKVGWYRSSTVKQMDCTDTGKNTQTLPTCQYAGPKNSFTTPCWTAACNGAVKAGPINKTPRRYCGP